MRVVYSASLPTPYEILNDIKKNSNINTVVSEISPQASVAGIEKKNNIIENRSAAEYVTFTKVEDFLKYLEQSKKALIEYTIKNDVSINSFTDGKISMNISNNIHQDFIMNLHKLLTDVTGKKWEIDVIKGELGETIADKEKSIVEASKRNVAEYPLVKKILEEFKGAKIETAIRKNLETLAEEEPEIAAENMLLTDIDEEE